MGPTLALSSAPTLGQTVVFLPPQCSSVRVLEMFGGASLSVFMTHPRSLLLGGGRWMGCVFLHLVWPLTFLTLSGGVLEFGVRASTLPQSIAAPAKALRFVPALPSAENLESRLHQCHSKHCTIRSL